MAIREEYQQLEAEIKKEEERSRTLDLISVGVLELDKALISYAAWLYDKTGQDLKELIDTIFLSFCEILKQEEKFINKSDIEDIIKRDKYQTLEAPLDTIYYVNFLLHIDFILTVLNHILKIRHSAPNSIDHDIKEKIGSTIKLCEDILAQCQNVDVDSIPFDLIKEYQLSSFPRIKDIFYDNYKDAILTIKQTRGLSNEEFDSYFETLAEKSYYCVIYSRVILLIIYLLFFDDEPKYVQLVLETLSRASDGNEKDTIQTSHTIEEIFNILKKFPEVAIKNMFLYFKVAGDINLMQYSSIIDAIHTSDLNLFKSAINNDIASFLDSVYPVITTIYMIALMFSSNTDQELEMILKYGTMTLTRFAPAFQFKSTNSTKILNRSSTPIDPQIIEPYINNSPVTLGYLAHFYKKHRQLLHSKDRRHFDTIFTQEPYKSYCDKALFELDKLYPNKSFQDFWRVLGFENNNQNHNDETISDVPTEDVTVSELESEPNECEMIPNPFKGLNGDAKKICNYDKKGYVGLFIDYLIDRGYIDCKNKDAFVCCMCEDMIPESALDNLKYNVKNKEGISNANIVTMMIVTLTKCKKKNNQIVVDGRIISKGCMYFNKGQINNGELEEWCLFWPFLKDRIKKGKRPLFQKIKSFLDSEIEDAKKRVEQFLNEYDEYKKGNPHSTKLDFIKMKHE